VLLVGDVGATSTRLALVAPGAESPVRETRLRSGEYASLEEAVRSFLRTTAGQADRAVFAVAGPVKEDRAELTNLGWSLEQDALARALDLRAVRLVNDLVAMAHVIPELGPESLETLQQGRPVPGGTLAVVAPGTGLGEAFLIWDGHAYRAHASEGGHADFAPTGALQVELLGRLRAGLGHVSVERVCSGRALPELYRFLRDRGATPETPRIAGLLAAAKDPTPVIVAAAREQPPCTLSAATVQLLAFILAAEAGNVALRVLATGGVYLAGGLPRRLLPWLTSPDFVTAFRDKGRLSPLLADVPLHVVTRPGLGLAGAIRYALSPEGA
jgi:glucokinase